MEGEFLKMPNGKDSKMFVRRESNLSEEKFHNLKDDWEKREVRDGVGWVRELVSKYEIRMTPHQKEVVETTIQEVNEVLKKYGVEGEASIERVKLLSNEFFKKNRKENVNGSFWDKLQVIIVKGENITDTMLAQIVFHEMMHMFSFQRIALIRGGKDGYPRVKTERMGLSIQSSEDNIKFFNQINEAITVELERRFWKKMKNQRIFNQDFWELKKMGVEGIEGVMLKKESEDEFNAMLTYPTQHRSVMDTFEMIYEKNKDEFNSVEEVFQVFVQAYFSGKLLKVARLIEKTFGKGKFREMGEE